MKQISSVQERFEQKIKVDPISGCHVWTGYKDKKGYSFFRVSTSLTMRGHKFSFLQAKGEIPKGLEIDHLCRNRGCVNPDHLEAVTHRVNVERGFGVGVINAAKMHCPIGHELTGDKGKRRCKICTNEVARKNYHKRKKDKDGNSIC